MPILMVKQVKGRRLPVCYTSDDRADRFAILQPKKVLLPLGFEGSIKEKGYTVGFFTMEDKKQSCNGIITFEEAYRYQNS